MDKVAPALTSTAEYGPMADLARLWRQVLARPDAPLDVGFFDLGGDAALAAELQRRAEALTGRRFNLEVFAGRPTLEGLAEQLGLAFTHTPPDGADDDGLTFWLVRRAAGPSRGLALCMPDLNGRAVTGAYAKAKFLPDHDLWACDARLPPHTVFDPRLWPVVARAAADRIVVGSAPRPSVLIGYSLAGYLAWLTARMLADTPLAARRIVTLDTLPLHYSKKDQSEGLTALLNALPPLSIPMLDIRRDVPAPFVPMDQVFGAWRPQDGDILTLPVETIDHFDMIRPHVLDRVAPYVARYVAEDGFAIPPGTRIDAVASFSGEVCALLHSHPKPDPRRLSGLIARHTEGGEKTALSALLFLALAHSPWDQADRACAVARRAQPWTVSFPYARSLLRWSRHFGPADVAARWAQAPATIPIPSRLAFELAIWLRTGGRAPPKSLRLILQGLAVIRARAPALLKLAELSLAVRKAVAPVAWKAPDAIRRAWLTIHTATSKRLNALRFRGWPTP